MVISASVHTLPKVQRIILPKCDCSLPKAVTVYNYKMLNSQMLTYFPSLIGRDQWTISSQCDFYLLGL